MHSPRQPNTESPVNLSFRPTSYTDFPGGLGALLNGISGQMRREMIMARFGDDPGMNMYYELEAARVGPPSLEAKVDERQVRAMNKHFGPWWLGWGGDVGGIGRDQVGDEGAGREDTASQ